MFDLTDVGFVKRITVGRIDRDGLGIEADSGSAMDLLNRCLQDTPRGKIIGIEKSLATHKVHDDEFVVQSLTYHVGFQRKPHWLSD